MNRKEEKELIETFETKLQGYRETTSVSFRAGLLRDLLYLARIGMAARHFCEDYTRTP